MPDISEYNGIDMADIASINGQDVPSGGGGGYPTSTTGLLCWGNAGAPTKPFQEDIFPHSSVPQSFSIFTPPSGRYVKQIVFTRPGHCGILLDNGDVYTTGTVSQAYMGRNSSTTPYTEFGLSLTGVAKLAPHYIGFMAVKTNGTMWYTGQVTFYFSGSSTASQIWRQYGTDTDWVDVVGHTNYPYVSYYVKGTGTGKRLYTSGYNQYGMTGQGTTSGTTTTPTLMKTAASTNFTDVPDKIFTGGNCFGVITTSGELYTVGRGTYGTTGHGTSSNTTYLTQVGTATDWEWYWPGAIGGFGIRNGALYGSVSNTVYYEIVYGLSGFSANRTFQQIGTDTDYEEIYGWDFSQSYTDAFKGLIVKKTNGWYINGRNKTGWNGSKGTDSLAAPGTFYDMTSATNLETPISSTGTVRTVAVTHESFNVQAPLAIYVSVS